VGRTTEWVVQENISSWLKIKEWYICWQDDDADVRYVNAALEDATGKLTQGRVLFAEEAVEDRPPSMAPMPL
jgi:hypothetical protein